MKRLKLWNSLHYLGAVVLALVPCAEAQTPQAPCWDCCPNPPCEIEPPPGPLPPVRAAFYYPWWNGWDAARGKARDKWDHCIKLANPQTDACGRPYVSDQHYWENYVYLHPDFNANGAFNVAVDLYDDRQESVQVTQFNKIRQEWIRVAIYSWWGQEGRGGKWGFTLERALGRVSVAPYLERRYEDQCKTQPDPPTCIRTAIANDIKHLTSEALAKPAFYWMGDAHPRPVIFAYGDSIKSCTYVGYLREALNQAEASYGVRPFVILDLVSDVNFACTHAVAADFAFHAYDPARANGLTRCWFPNQPQCSQTLHYGEAQRGSQVETITVRAGFHRCACTDDEIRRGRCTPASSPACWAPNLSVIKRADKFQSDVSYAMSRSPKYFVLINTWNEWLEGTAVEPGVEWWSSSGLGAFADALAALHP